MCYSPITIINPCKYVSVHHRDRFLLQVPCGKCAECQKSKSLEWNYRTYYEFIRTFEESNDNYVYFDTLTYDDTHLPTMSEIVSELPKVPCFRSSDITNFLKRLRINLFRKYGIDKDAFSYFICSEYGSLRHRPHYHLLLFVRKKVDPLELSALISNCWKCGRTDGVPYQSSFYVEHHNIINNSHLGDVIACAKYVTKYVEKDCKLQSLIDSRIKHAELVLFGKNCPYEKLGSVARQKLLTKISSEVDQFHMQSLHFGELAIRDIDLNELIKTGCVRMPSRQIVSLVPLPNYFFRKLFYERYKLYGNYGWQLNEDGKKFKQDRLKYLYLQMKSRLDCLNILANTNYDTTILTNYILNYRGRYRAKGDETTIEERLDKVTHYVYKTQSDKQNVGVGVSLEFLGNTSLGYSPFSSDIIKVKDFIEKYVYLDYVLEDQLKTLYSSTQSINIGKQQYYSRIQELESIFKTITI